MNLPNPLLCKIFEVIKNNPHQRITFAEFMDLCLYDSQYGYYSSNQIKIGGDSADFFTSASLSPDFAELIAIQLQELWLILDKPKVFSLVEMGAGEGIFALNILGFIRSNYSDFFACIQYIIIEKSASLRLQQTTLLADRFNVKWCSLDDLENNTIVGCFFSNELVDAFPIHLITLQGNELKEVYLSINNDNLVELYDDLSTDKISSYFQDLKIVFNEKYKDSYRSEVNLASLEWLEIVSKKIKKGFILTIDYGYTNDKYYHPQRYEGTLKCYYQHRHHDNPYVNLGQQDITSHVNFTALEFYGNKYDLETIGYIEQALFLMNLGLGDRLNELSYSKYSFSEIFSKRNQLHSLINPEGLGNFKVLLQGKNLEISDNKLSLKGFNHY